MQVASSSPNKEPTNGENDTEDKDCHKNSKVGTEEGTSSNTECDQDSEVSIMDDTGEDIDTGEIEGEDWIEYKEAARKKTKRR